MMGAITLGLMGAAFNAGLVAALNHALHAEPDARGWLAAGFAALAMGKVGTGYVSGRLLYGFAQRTMAELRRELVGKLLTVPYRRLERIGAARIQAVLTQDLTALNSALQGVPGAVINGAVLLGASAYLVHLHWPTFIALLVAAVPGILLYRSLSGRARSLWQRQRKHQDRLYSHYRALTEGARELKMNAERRQDFLQRGVHDTTQAVLDYDVQGNTRVLTGQAVNSFLVLAMLGLLLFALPAAAGAPGGGELVTGFALTGLYLVGPLGNLLRLLPLSSKAQIALARIEDLGVALKAAGEQRPPVATGQRHGFERIELREVCYRYSGGDEAGFALGPLSLSITPGELLFITGGNGSGKSTLAKLLSGLYAPDIGTLRWDGQVVTDDKRDDYRQLWSTVFSEFFLFDCLYGLQKQAREPRAQALLEQLGLNGVVTLHAGAPSAGELSRGQQKRLALLVALLEDRPVYLFDEWAAEQDPGFKEVFYRRIVVDLAQRGKAVVVVTHDDRYFNVAQRLLTVYDGKLIEYPRPREVSRTGRPKTPLRAT